MPRSKLNSNIMSPTWVVVACLLLNGIVDGRQGYGPGHQDWGYVTVRPGAQMFYWLYYVNPPSGQVNVYSKPLLIWLQGGPGGSGTGYGNFEGIGPRDVEGNYRNYTWVRNYNILFIDNPVGTGFSIVDNNATLATTNRQIAIDLMQCIKTFLARIPEFQNVPTYINGQSYGGKMAVEFALLWYNEQQERTIRSNLLGVALGDSSISAIDSLLTWGPFLFYTGMIDAAGKEQIEESAKKAEEAGKAGRWLEAREHEVKTGELTLNITKNMNVFNILKPSNLPPPTTNPRYERLTTLMNNHVGPALNVSKEWQLLNAEVLEALDSDNTKPVDDIVKHLVYGTNLKVIVYTGQLDMVVSIAGTVAWIDRMFSNDALWSTARREPLVVEGIIEGYTKKYKNFHLYWINRAGHTVPTENPTAMAAMLKELTGL